MKVKEEAMEVDESGDESAVKDEPRFLWVRVRDAQQMLWDNNPNKHELQEIIESIQRYGIQELPVLDKNIGIKSGNGRTISLGIMEREGMGRPRGIRENDEGEWLMPLITGVDALNESEAIAYAFDANNIGLTGMTATEKAEQWESEAYLKLIRQLEEDQSLPVSVGGDDLAELLALVGGGSGSEGEGGEGRADRDKGIEDGGFEDLPVPVELQKKWGVQEGDLWMLGEHRLLCGDCTDPDVLAALFGEKVAVLVHADPPYGMGKEKDGVLNDNLYKYKLDDFQTAWWKVMRKHTLDKGSVYVWGNPEDLWRWWFTGWTDEDGSRQSIATTEKMLVRNEIVWDKKSIAGMASDLLTQFPIASERCLFIQIGEQFLGNVNKEDYWSGWDAIRVPLKEEADRAGITPKLIKETLGVSMYSHWFSESQWCLIPPQHYARLQEHYLGEGYFLKPYEEIRWKYDQLRGGFRDHFNEIQGGMRSYFDNAHDVMRDVWEYKRVSGDERFGHATPKPVEMIERIIKSSTEKGDVMFVPFGGTGPEWVGAENLSRICYGTELSPEFCAVILERWARATGKEPVKEQ